MATAEMILDFRELINNSEWKALKTALNSFRSDEVAILLSDFSENDRVILFRLLTREQAKEVFRRMSRTEQDALIEGFAANYQKISNLLNDIEPDDRTALFEELPGQVTRELLHLLSPEERSITNQLLGYPKESIGRLMTPEYVAVKPKYTVARAFEHIRKFGIDSETLNVIYIVDDERKLIDDIRIKELILASPDEFVHQLIDHHFIALNAMDDQETAIRVFRDTDRVALPVVNEEGVLLGIVTVDDMLDVAEEESTEDFHKFGSFQSAISDPVTARIGALYKSRVVWLVALVFMNVFSGAALGSFENIIQSVVSLVFFLPLLINSSGNAGSQSATLMIRYLAVGDVQKSAWLKLIGKEILVSFLLGFTMSIGVALIAAVRDPQLILVVSATMVITVMIGSLIGLLLPVIFTKLKLDPATASAPLITSIADITGVIIYLKIATWYFGF